MKHPVSLATTLLLVSALAAPVQPDEPPKPDHSQVPGVPIAHSPASSGIYIGSPGIVILPDGTYVASHDFFGPKSREHHSAITAIFRSQDRGKTWKQVSQIDGAFWSSLFVHRGHSFLMGTEKHHGAIVIRRSDDGGRSWTTPRSSDTGRLTEKGEYHTAPVPVMTHNGRVWRGFEDEGGGKQWGVRYRAMMLSAPVDADLLKRDSWTFSNYIARDPKWMGGTFQAWLEGNAVVTPEGQVVDILRMHYGGQGGKAAVIHIGPDGTTASFDPETGFIDLPGGAKKFTIRYDPQSRAYWSLTNPVMQHTDRNAGGVRNTLALLHSEDLRNWQVRCILLHHPDVVRHAFQYPDWVFEGDDIIAAVRTAYDDGLGRAHRAHDANYLTFHRFGDFRNLTMADSVVDPKSLQPPGPVNSTWARWSSKAGGSPWKRWRKTPRPSAIAITCGSRCPRNSAAGDTPKRSAAGTPTSRLRRIADTTVHIATATSQQGIDIGQWEPEAEITFHYTDLGRTGMKVFQRRLKVGERIEIPQGNWTGGILLAPPEDSK